MTGAILFLNDPVSFQINEQKYTELLIINLAILEGTLKILTVTTRMSQGEEVLREIPRIDVMEVVRYRTKRRNWRN